MDLETLANQDFLREHVSKDIAEGNTRVLTRFPPEPNGYLHIGHSKAICINFGIAADFGGHCNLRFDDTNPTKEESHFVEAIQEDVKWLGFDWEDRLFFASDYFEKLYDLAVGLIEDGKAYVDDLTAEEIREHRGTLTDPGSNSPYRDRPIEENLDLFARMRAGEFSEGAKTLRAKIDMTSGNLNMRDPVLYRIQQAHHHRTGDAWCIYPMYDYAHAASDAIENITHSLCTVEFEDHRPLYDWVVRESRVEGTPRQIEFAPLALTNTVLSKRILRRLVEEGLVEGWDDPRLPTLMGLRRRGFVPQGIVEFCSGIGIAKRDSVVDWALLEFHQRRILNLTAQRVMAVLRPLKVVITNYPEGQTEMVVADNNPENEADGTRDVPFGREIYIEATDFLMDPPKKFFRLGPGREVRLKHAYFITCDEAITDDQGQVIELRCTYDPESRGGKSPDGRKVRGTLQWVSAEHGSQATVRLIAPLFEGETIDTEDVTRSLNPNSMEVLPQAVVEPCLAEAQVGERFQFMRHGYFAKDSTSTKEHPVFNLTVTLKDSYPKK